MAHQTLQFSNGRRVSFDLHGELAATPGFVLSMRKSGSTVANKICRAMADGAGRCFVDLAHVLFENNFIVEEWCWDPGLRAILDHGAIFGGFRDPPMALFHDPIFINAPKVLIVRDPRDAVVSEYFSNAYSHVIPDAAQDSDGLTRRLKQQRREALEDGLAATVLRRAELFRRWMGRYEPVLKMPNTVLMHYEQFIFDKRKLMACFAKMFGVNVGADVIENVLAGVDLFPSDDDHTRFVRQVRPGDHRRKLDPVTISVLDAVLRTTLRLFGYA